MRQLMGDLLPRLDEGCRSLVMRTVAGTATGDDGTVYDLSTNTFSGEPVVESQGRTWTLRWRDLIRMAEDRGLLGFKCPCGVAAGPQADGSPPEGWAFRAKDDAGDMSWFCPDCAEGVTEVPTT